MAQITRKYGWCSYDELDGERLVHEERLFVTWPTGAITTEVIGIEKWSEQISDHGHSSSYSQERSIVWKYVDGLRVAVPLAGLEAKRVVE